MGDANSGETNQQLGGIGAVEDALKERKMQAVKVEAWIEKDGELHLTNLPCAKWDHVEVIILIHEKPTEKERQEALQRCQAHADASTFRSVDPYPTRDELHERH